MKPYWQEVPLIPDIPEEFFYRWLKKLEKKKGLFSHLPKTFARRLIFSRTQLRKFSNPKYYHLENPFVIRGMEKLVEYINSLDKNRKILIFGDRDVDGIFSTAMLYRYMTEKLELNVGWQLPEKRYGISLKDVKDAIKEGFTDIITLDNGITAFQEAKLASENGVNFVVIDHHSPKDALPAATLIVDPKVESSSDLIHQLENRFLSTGGLIFKAIQAVEFSKKSKFYNKEIVFIDMEPQKERLTSRVIGGEFGAVIVRNGVILKTRKIKLTPGETSKAVSLILSLTEGKLIAGFNIKKADFSWLTSLSPEIFLSRILELKEKSLDIIELLPSPSLRKMKLHELAEMLGIYEGNFYHDPLFDAYITSRIFYKLQTSPEEEMLKKYLPAAAITTLADMVPLIGENKIIASLGLKILEESSYEPLSMLVEKLVKNKSYPGPLFERPFFEGAASEEEFDGEKSLESVKKTVIYRIAPVINAAARSGKANLAMKLMTYRYRENMNQIIEELLRIYEKHRKKAQEAFKEIEKKATDTLKSNPQKLSLIFKIAKKESDLVGLLASRAAGTFNRPVIVLYKDGNTMRGSARAVGKLNLQKLLEQLREKYADISFGGHSHAMGIRFPSILKIKNIEKDLEKIISTHIESPEELGEVIYYEEEIDPKIISVHLAEILESFQPYGEGNPEPTFLIKEVKVKSVYASHDEKHLFLTLQKNNSILDCVMWNASEEAKDLLISSQGKKCDVIVRVKFDRRNQPPSVRLELVDFDMEPDQKQGILKPHKI